MYNRYIPQPEECTWVRTDSGMSQNPERKRQQRGISLPSFLSGQEGISAFLSNSEGKGGLSRVLKALHLEQIDTGDILLLLIVLYLLAEGDDLDLVIALGLVLIMGLGEDEGD